MVQRFVQTVQRAPLLPQQGRPSALNVRQAISANTPEHFFVIPVQLVHTANLALKAAHFVFLGMVLIRRQATAAFVRLALTKKASVATVVLLVPRAHLPKLKALNTAPCVLQAITVQMKEQCSVSPAQLARSVRLVKLSASPAQLVRTTTLVPQAVHFVQLGLVLISSQATASCASLAITKAALIPTVVRPVPRAASAMMEALHHANCVTHMGMLHLQDHRGVLCARAVHR